jgi:hypothetical protein
MHFIVIDSFHPTSRLTGLRGGLDSRLSLGLTASPQYGGASCSISEFFSPNSFSSHPRSFTMPERRHAICRSPVRPFLRPGRAPGPDRHRVSPAAPGLGGLWPPSAASSSPFVYFNRTSGSPDCREAWTLDLVLDSPPPGSTVEPLVGATHFTFDS